MTWELEFNRRIELPEEYLVSEVIKEAMKQTTIRKGTISGALRTTAVYLFSFPSIKKRAAKKRIPAIILREEVERYRPVPDVKVRINQ